jgi:hypothetical protein
MKSKSEPSSPEIPEYKLNRGEKVSGSLKDRIAQWERIWPSPEQAWKTRFLKIFAKTKNMGRAIVSCGTNRAAINRERKFDSAFDSELTDLWESFVDDLEASAMDRATHGTFRFHYDRDGNMTSVERKYETQLTIFMLQANRSKYNIKVDDGTTLEDVVNKFHAITQRLKNSVPELPSKN